MSTNLISIFSSRPTVATVLEEGASDCEPSAMLKAEVFDAKKDSTERSTTALSTTNHQFIIDSAIKSTVSRASKRRKFAFFGIVISTETYEEAIRNDT